MKYFWFVIVLFFLACGSKSSFNSGLNLDSKESNENFYMSIDTPQDLSVLPYFQGETRQDNYKEKFFSPWHFKAAKLKEEEIFWAFALYLNPNKEYYFYNKQSIPKDFFKKIIANANTSAFLSLKKKALITRSTYLKNLPVNTSILLNPFKQGEGLPFDYALDSVLNLGTPVLVSHYTKDKEYVFVLAEGGWGFVLASDIEFFTNERARIYENLGFITPLEEALPVYDEKGNFAFSARIGAIYPYYKKDEKYFYGKIGQLKYKIARFKASEYPLSFDDVNVKAQIKQLLGLPYGWGGYDLQRDCSLLLHDFFAPFGLHLPRNSLAQSRAWHSVDISFLNNTQKLDFIKNYAKAYTTLLYLKGHIMLYVGGEDILAFHSPWGLRTKDNGRKLISRTVLTTLDIGKDEKDIAYKDLLLSRLLSISFLNLSKSEQEAMTKALAEYK